MPKSKEEIQPLLLAEEFSGLEQLIDLGEEAVPALLEILEENSDDDFLSYRCLIALGRIGSPLGAEAVIARLESGDRVDRIHAVRALAGILGADVSPHLLPLLDDPDLSLRKVAIQCLGAKGGREVVLALEGIVAESTHEFLREQARAAIEQIQEREP